MAWKIDEQEPVAGFNEVADTPYVADFLSTNEGVQLNRAFLRIKDPKMRRRVVDLVNAIAGEEELIPAASQTAAAGYDSDAEAIVAMIPGTSALSA